jgi:hypothetical protein
MFSSDIVVRKNRQEATDHRVHPKKRYWAIADTTSSLEVPFPLWCNPKFSPESRWLGKDTAHLGRREYSSKNVRAITDHVLQRTALASYSALPHSGLLGTHTKQVITLKTSQG